MHGATMFLWPIVCTFGFGLSGVVCASSLSEPAQPSPGIADQESGAGYLIIHPQATLDIGDSATCHRLTNITSNTLVYMPLGGEAQRSFLAAGYDVLKTEACDAGRESTPGDQIVGIGQATFRPDTVQFDMHTRTGCWQVTAHGKRPVIIPAPRDTFTAYLARHYPKAKVIPCSS